MLIGRTLNKIPKRLWGSIILTTDDHYLINKYGGSVRIHFAPPQPSMKGVLQRVIRDCKIGRGDNLITLYTTFPNRSKEDIAFLLKLFNRIPNRSLLCRVPVITHPHLCVWRDGTQVVENDLCHRQTFPPCFQISHYFSIIRASEVVRVRKNLYNEGTYFFDIPRSKHIDIDRREDLNG